MRAMKTMKLLKALLSTTVLSSLLIGSGIWAAEKPAGGTKDAKLKPYTLKTCVISGEKLGGMGEPYVYKYQDREIKFCCKGCLKEFNKDPDKYVKAIQDAEKKAK